MDEAPAANEPVSPTVSTSSSSASTSKANQRPLAKASSASSLEGKKGLQLGPFRLTLPRTKKNKTIPTDDLSHMNPPKKVKREKSFLRSLTSKKSTSTLGEVKEKKATSSIASKLVRKISFVGKTKGDKKVNRATARSEPSPSTSQEELEGTAAAGSSRPSTPMDLDSSDTFTAAATSTTTVDAADVDVKVAGGVELAGTSTDQSVPIVRVADPLPGSPVERAHLVEAGTGTGTVADTSLRGASDQVGSPSATNTSLNISQHTSKLRAAWMSLPESVSADAKGDEPGPATTLAKTTREQILNITAPAWESQQREKRRREAKVTDAKVRDGDADAGTSHSEVFSTPTESSDAEAQSPLTLTTKSVSAVLKTTTSKSTLETGAVSTPTTSAPALAPPASLSASPIASTSKSPTSATPVTPTLAPSEDILAKPESQQYPATTLEETIGTLADATGEDLMAEARARLSQSLGVNAPPASPSVQQGGGNGEKREHLYKILVIGELGTGKTSIIKRYVHQFFSQHYRATIGVDFALKVLNWDANTIIRLQLWDIAGQERFGNMTRVYYKEAVAAFVVFDVTRQGTFDAVLKWKQDLDSKVQLPDGSAIPCILLANKCDLQKEGLVNYPGKMDEYCKDRGFAGWFEISAKENINIEEAARLLVTKILANEQAGVQGEAARDADKLHLGSSTSADDSRSKCSC